MIKTDYLVKVTVGYTTELEFRAGNLREAGYIADLFLDNLEKPKEVKISIVPDRYEVNEEDVKDE